MLRVAKYPDIVDIDLVALKENTSILYTCGHTSIGKLENLLYKGNNSFCKICTTKTAKKSNRQFLEEVSQISLDIEFLEEYKGSNIAISFKYKSCGHTSKVSPHSLFGQGAGLICRVCNPISRTNTQFLDEISIIYPDLEFTEDFTKVRAHISFKYKSCGHTGRVRGDVLLGGKRLLICRICNPIKSISKKSNEEFLNEVKVLNPDILLLGEYSGNRYPIKFKYKLCHHEHKVTPSNLLSKGQGLICRVCNPIRTSKGEKEIAELLSKYTAVETSNRTILGGLEIDIYLPQLNLGIEYNGEYWHSEDKKGRNYHLDKTNLAESKGIRLVHIFEHEWLNKQEIVKSRLLGMLQQNYKLGARLCTIRELTFSDVRSFLNENHLQGAGSSSSINLGLYHKDILVAVMTFSKPRFNSNYDYELIRYASLTGINIQGGASKLLKYFTNNYKGSIISYSDKRWSQGNLYKTIGFEFSHSSDPDYFYAKNNSILSRYQCQKHRLKVLFPSIYRDELTETDIMTSAGYYKVYGCGNDVWVLSNIKGKMGNGQ